MPAAWTNLERTHEPSARNQPTVGNQQPASKQSTEQASLLPHKGPRPSGPSELSDTLWPGTSNLPTAVAAREARLAIRAISITESSSLLGRERAVAGLPANHQHTTRTSSAFSVIAPSLLGCGGRGKHQPSVGVPGAPRTSFNWPTHGLGRRACAAGGLANVCCAVFPRACPRTGNIPFTLRAIPRSFNLIFGMH